MSPAANVPGAGARSPRGNAGAAGPAGSKSRAGAGRVKARQPSGWWAAAALVLLAAAGLLVGLVAAPSERARSMGRWRDQLSAMADDRSSALERWVAERFGDARYVAAMPSVVASADEHGGSDDARRRTDAIMRLVAVQADYLSGAVFAADGRQVAEFGEPLGTDPADLALVKQCVTADHTLVGLYLRGGTKPVVHFVVPIRGGATAAPVGAVLLTADPENWLYPFLAHQPVPTATGETALMEREGGDAVFLTPLRFSAAAPLTLRRPLSTPGFAAAAALGGGAGFSQYVDYRGVPVLASARGIRGTPWGLVVKVDRDEALASYRRWLAGTLAGLAALLLAAAGLVYGGWNRSRLRVREAAAANERRLAELVNEAANAVFVLSAEGRVVQANRRAEELYGYSAKELRGMTAADLRAPEAREDAEATVRRAVAGGPVLVETVHSRRDGSTFPVEVSVHHADVRGERFLLEIVRDIGPQKAAEARIIHLNRLLRTISEINQLIVRERDRDRLLGEACRILVGHGGFRMAWVGFADEGSGVVVPAAWAGHEDGYLGSVTIRFDDTPLGRDPTGTAIREGRAVAVENWEADERVAPWREAARRRGYASSAAYPIPVGGAVTGAFTVYAAETGAFGAEVTDLLAELAGDLGFALETIATEQELHASEERYRLIINNTSDGIFTLDLEGRVTFASPRWVKDVGYTQAEVIGRHMTNFVSDESPAAAWETFSRALRGEDIQPYEIELLQSNGAHRPYEISMSNLTGAAGEVIGRIGIIRDISERKRAEDALHESEARYRSLFEQSPLGIYRTKPDGTIVAASPALLRLLGYASFEELASRNLELDGYEPRYPRREFKEWVERDGEVIGFESAWLRKDGRVVEVRESARAVRDPSDRTLYYEGTVEDVTEVKRGERERMRLAAAVEQAAEAIVITDLDGRIEYVNPAFERVTGYTRAEMVGKNSSILKSGRHDEAFYAALWRTIAGGGTWQGHFVNRRKDGGLFEEDATISPVRDGAGAIVNFVAVKRDVTQEVALQAQLNQAQKMEAVGSLAGGVAHDFNNLLQVLLSQAELLRIQAHDPERVRALGVELGQQINHGASLTRQLLLFSRRETAKTERLDLNDSVRAAMTMLRRLVRANIALEVKLAPEALPVNADRGQLEQVLVNLAVNASDAMPGGGTLTMRTATHESGWVRLTVEDTGAGIPEAIRERIFDPFFTTKGAGKGTWLGLSVVHGIVTRHGGRFEVESVEGQGSVFRVILPAAGAGEVPAAQGVPQEAAELPAGHGERILIVEDENAAREALRDILGGLGYEVVAAASGEEAGLLPAEEPFDVLLTDLMLPGIGGPQLVVGLRDRWPSLRVILMSGYTEDEVARRGIAEGTVRFLQKPFGMAALARELRAVLADALRTS